MDHYSTKQPKKYRNLRLDNGANIRRITDIRVPSELVRFLTDAISNPIPFIMAWDNSGFRFISEGSDTYCCGRVQDLWLTFYVEFVIACYVLAGCFFYPFDHGLFFYFIFYILGMGHWYIQMETVSTIQHPPYLQIQYTQLISMHLSSTPSTQAHTIGPYKIINTVNQLTRNKLLIVEKVTSPNVPLYILKVYRSQEGYIREKYVFQIKVVRKVMEGEMEKDEIDALYGDYLVDVCDHAVYEGNPVQYTVGKYCTSGSMMELGAVIKQFPFEVAKFYFHNLLTQLHLLHSDPKLPYRTLYISDLLFGPNKQLIIVGWSKDKDKQQTTQQQLIYDCAEVMYYMLTNSPFQQQGLGFKGQEKKRFLPASFWDIKKKRNYLRFFPEDAGQLQKLISFMGKITVRNEEQPVNIEKVLADPFFTDLITFQTASELLTKKQMEFISIHKQKVLKQFDIKTKRTTKGAKIQQQEQGSGHRGSSFTLSLVQQYQTIKCPLFIPLDKNNHQKACEHKEVEGYCQQQFDIVPHHKQSNSRQRIEDLVQKFFTTKFQASLHNLTILQQQWVYLTEYKLAVISGSNNNQTIYHITCWIQYTQSSSSQQQQQQLQQQQQQQLSSSQSSSQQGEKQIKIVSKEEVNFSIVVNWAEEKVGESCVAGWEINVERNVNQVLMHKLTNYVTEGLRDCFKFRDN